MNTQDEAAHSLRYPVGDMPRQSEVSAEQIKASQSSIAVLPANLRTALAGLDDWQLDTAYREGGWTVRELVHHVADSHVNMFVRFKLAMTEDWPTIRPYDQDTWVKLADSRLPPEVSLTLLDSLHRRWSAIMLAMGDQDWQRGFVHPETGRWTLAQAATLYDWHGRHHVAHVTELRKRMGW